VKPRIIRILRAGVSLSALLQVVIFASAGRGLLAEMEIEPYVVRRETGYFDWSRATAAAWGEVTVLKSRAQAVTEAQLREQAAYVAKQRLRALLGELPVDADSRLEDRPDLLAKALEFVAQGYVLDEREGRMNLHEVLWAIPLRGPEGLQLSLLGLLHPGSVPAGAFEAPPPNPVRRESSDPTTIVIDATGAQAGPVLFPRILDEGGSVIASTTTADPACVARRGFVSYAWEMPSAPADLRAEGSPPRTAVRLGENPLRVKAGSASGSLGGDIVLPGQEVARLRATPGAADLMRGCAIVILLDPPPSDLAAPPRAPAGKGQPPQKSKVPIEAPAAPGGR